jgi:hypothetical protein
MADIQPMAGGAAFDPETTTAMATAVDEVCKALRLNGDKATREIIAMRVVELARQGEHDPRKLRDRLFCDGRILIAEARIARQRELIALLEARHADTSAAKSLLSAMQYSLKVLRRHLQSEARNGSDG